jgi:hypothetical protein
VTSVEGLSRAVAGFVVDDLDLAAEPAAAAAAQRSLEDSGLLLLGEMHGARENPLLARALTRLHQQHGSLVLDLPTAQEAVVPHRSGRWPPPAAATS